MQTRKRKGRNQASEERKSKKKQTQKAKSSKSSSNGGLSCLKIFLFIDFALVICFVIGYYTSPITALPYDGWEDMPLSGKFEINNKLTNGIKIPLNAPESIEVDEEGNLYAGLHDGRIVKIYVSPKGKVGLGRIENITNGIFAVADTTDGSTHGRPMGIRLRNNVLYVMDSVYGFYLIDLKSKIPSFLVRPHDVSPSMKFPNDVDITSDGRYAYFTVSSSLYTLKDVADIGLLDGSCNGRLFRFDMVSKKLDVIGKDYCFNNGIQLRADEKTVLMPETSRRRAIIVDLESGKTLKSIGFPMLPDNVRRSKRGTYWLTGSNVPTFLGQLGVKSPALRQAVAGTMPKMLIRLLVPFMFNTNHNIVVEINEGGEIVRTLQDPTGSLVVGASQVTELNDGRLVVGSYFGPNAAIVKI